MMHPRIKINQQIDWKTHLQKWNHSNKIKVFSVCNEAIICKLCLTGYSNEIWNYGLAASLITVRIMPQAVNYMLDMIIKKDKKKQHIFVHRWWGKCDFCHRQKYPSFCSKKRDILFTDCMEVTMLLALLHKSYRETSVQKFFCVCVPTGQSNTGVLTEAKECWTWSPLTSVSPAELVVVANKHRKYRKGMIKRGKEVGDFALMRLLMETEIRKISDDGAF